MQRKKKSFFNSSHFSFPLPDSLTLPPSPLPTSLFQTSLLPLFRWVSPSHSYSNLSIQECSKLVTQLPLYQVAGLKGIIQVQAPFSMSDLFQIQVRLGSFLANPAKLTKEFEYLTHSYDLSWSDIHIIFSMCTSSEERSHIWAKAQRYGYDLNWKPPNTSVLSSTAKDRSILL